MHLPTEVRRLHPRTRSKLSGSLSSLAETCTLPALLRVVCAGSGATRYAAAYFETH